MVLLAGAAAALIGGPTVLAFSHGWLLRPAADRRPASSAWALVVVAVCVAPRPLPASTAGPDRARRPGPAVRLDGAVDLLGAARRTGGGRPPAPAALPRLLHRGARAPARPGRARLARAGARPRAPWSSSATALSERLFPGLVELSRSGSARRAAGAADHLLERLRHRRRRRAGARRRGSPAIRTRPAACAPRRRGRRAARARRLPHLRARRARRRSASGVLMLLALAPAGRAQLRASSTASRLAAVAAVVASSCPRSSRSSAGSSGDSQRGPDDVRRARGARRGGRARSSPRQAAPAARAAAPAGVAPGAVLRVDRCRRWSRPSSPSPCSRASPRARRPRTAPIRPGWARSTPTATATGRSRCGASARRIRSPGSGPAGFLVEWLKERDRVDRRATPTRSISRPRRSSASSGSALLAMFLGGVVAALVRLYRLDPGPRRPGSPAGWPPGRATPGWTGTGRCRPRRCRRCCSRPRRSRGAKNPRSAVRTRSISGDAADRRAGRASAARRTLDRLGPGGSGSYLLGIAGC